MANYYFRNSGNVNWGTATNWSLSDGGPGDGAVPTSSDNAYFTANSGNCTVNAAARICRILNFTGYTNTITMNNQITASNAVTLSATMGILGTQQLVVDGTATHTSNGKTWPNNFVFAGSSITHTLADDWDINGNINFSGASVVVNGQTIYAGKGLTSSLNAGAGTTNIVFDGTGTWSTPGYYIANNLTFNTAGTITISGYVYFGRSKTITYTAGTMVVAGSTLVIALGGGETNTLNTNGMSWNNIEMGLAGTETLSLSSLLTVNETFTNNGFGGNLTFSGAAGFSIATLDITATGTRNLTLTHGNTYTVTTAINNRGSTSALRTRITSSHASNQVVLTLNQGATVECAYLNGTRIDSSGGRTIRTFGGTLTTCTNWQSFTDLLTVASTFVN